MANGSGTVQTTNQVLSSLALTTSENNYTFTCPNGALRLFRVQMTCDQAWHYSHQTGGPYYPVPASPAVLELDLPNGTTVIYTKTQTAAAATLNFLVTDNEVQGV